MQKTFFDEISVLENFMDGLIFIDTEGRVIFHKMFPGSNLKIKESETVGKKLEEIFLDYDLDTSPLYRALRYGEFSINKLMKLRFYNGEELWTVNTVYPVKKEGQIIGAVSASQAINHNPATNCIEVPPGIAPLLGVKAGKLSTVNDIIGESPSIQRLKSNILKISETTSNVMIVGQTGTGKELVAQSIHSHSKRNHKPFIVQNCAAIPATLLESLFFGTTKGSFTGATDSPGIFEQADGGTVFLDEVNSMDIALQSKILRVLEDQTIVRLGGKTPVRVDVRIISATNQPPKVCLAKGLLRRDLYYRLSTLQLRLPALSERMEDLPLLIKYFIGEYNRKMGRSIQDVSPQILSLLNKYDWPGNIRELKNVMETAFNFAEGPIIMPEDLPDYIWEEKLLDGDESPYWDGEDEQGHSPDGDLPLREAVDNFEKEYILSRARGCDSMVHLADRLHISKQLLNHKIKKYDLKINF